MFNCTMRNAVLEFIHYILNNIWCYASNFYSDHFIYFVFEITTKKPGGVKSEKRGGQLSGVLSIDLEALQISYIEAKNVEERHLVGIRHQQSIMLIRDRKN